jgi:hypothetical protein
MDQVWENGVLVDVGSVFGDPAIAAQSATDWAALSAGILGRWADSEIATRYQVKTAPLGVQGTSGNNSAAGIPSFSFGGAQVNGLILLAGLIVGLSGILGVFLREKGK